MYSAIRFAPKLFYKGRSPIHLTFFITNICNSKCEYCLYDVNTQKSNILKADEVEKIAKSIKGNLLWLLLSGGEPFLNQEIDKICEAFYKNNKPTFITIPTNGLLSEVIKNKLEKIARECPKSKIILKISLDGWGDDHDKLRGVKGNFDKFLETIAVASKIKEKYKNVELGVNSVFLVQNQDKIYELYQKIKTLESVDYFSFGLVRGSKIEKKWKEVDIEKYREFSEKILGDALKEKVKKYSFPLSKLKLAADLLQRRLIYKIVKEKKQQIPCYAGRLNLVLTETGDVYPCELLSWKFGNLRESNYDIDKTLSNQKTKKYLSMIQAGTKVCDNCTHECNMTVNILFNPKQLVKAMKLLQ